MAFLPTHKTGWWVGFFALTAFLLYPSQFSANYPDKTKGRPDAIGQARISSGNVGFAEQGSQIKGIYGVPSISKLDRLTVVGDMERAGVNAVFVSPDRDTVTWFKKRGFRVYVSVNAFGGKGAWKLHPDARPVRSDGRLLGEEPDLKEHGGVCPTHKGWRQERLDYVTKLVDDLGGVGGIDGIWLDFIRYPGLWETKDPSIPDTCYCHRCLKKFQQDTEVSIPGELRSKDAAVWIKKNCRYQWMKWKKGQISSFVEEVRDILCREPSGNPLTLGVFLVPWTKGERNNDISFKLAQDAFELSAVADVISPMVYHKMVGKPESWVGYMTQYYKESARCRLVPIVQSLDCVPEEFQEVSKAIGQSGADGFLVYSFRGMTPDLWGGLKAFKSPTNLIRNPDLTIPDGEKFPTGWYTGEFEGDTVKKSLFFIRSSDRFDIESSETLLTEPATCLGISAGYDRAGKWCSPLPPCEAGQEYVFSCLLYRDTWQNGVYPRMSFWGEEFHVDTHWQSHRFQPIRLHVQCPPYPHENTFCFVNYDPGNTFWLTRPSLTKSRAFRVDTPVLSTRPFFYGSLFPIGVYGANLNNLEAIKKLGICTVLVGSRGEELKKIITRCHELGLRYVVSVPRDPDKLLPFLKEIEEVVQSSHLAFYVNDEPGIHSFPMNRAQDINRLIKARFPDAATCMAIVRPRVCRDYVDSADFFMMDQYPVPDMPMTWLSDSMEQAGKDVGRDRLASIIQAFGGEKWAWAGWPRFPTWQEMDCLAFLSIVHGSRGIFFYTFSEIESTQEGLKSLKMVVGRLNHLYHWLSKENHPWKVDVEMVSPYGVDPKGRSAVQCCIKKRGNEFLLIAVNTIGTSVEVIIKLKDSGNQAFGECEEVFSGEIYPADRGTLRSQFRAYETRAFVFSAFGP